MRELANLYAQREPDPAARRSLAGRLAQQPGVQVSTRGGWVVAVEPVTSGLGDATTPAAFAEGREHFLGRPGSPTDWANAAERLRGNVGTLRLHPGDFTAFSFDHDDELTVVRSAAGVVPVYVWPDRERPAASTRLRDLVRWAIPRPQLDLPALAIFAAARRFPKDSTSVAGVRMLPTGTRASSRRGFLVERYWDPAALDLVRPTRTARREHAERLRALLINELDEGLADAGNLLTLSGGVDSSVLALLACERLGRRISTLTFLPEDVHQRQLDQAYVDRVQAEIPRGHEGHTQRVLTPASRLELLRRAPSSVFPAPHPALCLLPDLARERPIRVYLGGEFADMLIGSLTVEDDWMATTGLSDVAGLPDALPYVARRGAHWARFLLRRSMGAMRVPGPAGLPEFFAAEFQTQYRDWCSDEQRRLGQTTTHRPFLRHRLERASAVVAMNWEVASSLGVARRFPFFSREQVELAYSSHPLLHAGRGSKRSLRQSLEGVLPQWALERADKGQGGARPRAWTLWSDRTPPEIAPLLRPEWLHRPTQRLETNAALRLQELLNIVGALGNEGQYREQSADAENPRPSRLE